MTAFSIAKQDVKVNMLLEFRLSVCIKLSTSKQVYQTRKNKEKGRNSLHFVVIFNHDKNITKQKGANPSMTHSITDTYKMKREILNFERNFSGGLSAPDAMFFADMTYGILASQSCLLTKIAHALQEKTKKAYMVDRLSDHLKDGINDKAMAAYLNYVRKMVPSEPVVHIDDSDVTKPDGYHFEALGTVRDGSKSTTKKCHIRHG